ncbi:MAG: adenosylmethionine decarboxylase [Candidatus Peribacteria bacterium]|jgi:spermidine synthase|nr:adenosylmethionine decarboxylase [Candidatus Peribacteria bacterium]
MKCKPQLQNKLKNFPNGIHYLVDLHGCDQNQINKTSFLFNTIEKIIKNTDIKILNSKFKKFNPKGVTGYFLLSSSHISIHTWPEFQYCCIDIFTCARDDVSEEIKNQLIQMINHSDAIVKKINRGFQCNIRELANFSNNKSIKINIQNTLYSVVNKYQKIEIVETNNFGKCLIIDDIMQASEKDHSLYDNCLTKYISTTDKNVLIIGGGDLFVANNISTKNTNIRKIQIVDIDKDVFNSCLHFFHHKKKDKKIKISFMNAIKFLKNNNKTLKQYSYIISDLTDSPVGGKEKEFEKFYINLLNLILKNTKKDTRIVIQTGTTKVKNGVSGFEIIKKIIVNLGYNINIKTIFIPSFGEKTSFILFKK